MQDTLTFESSSRSVADSPAARESRATTRAAALCAGLAGLGLLWTVGFSHMDALHALAHDTRHAAVFPCH
jgi:cobalt transporter subunit CbtB